MAGGIRKRPPRNCRSRGGGRCNWRAGWEASIYLAREGKKVRRTFDREAEARSWRNDTHSALAERSQSGPSLTLEQGAWLWLEAARTGRVRDRSGHTYKPATLREYARVLRLGVLSDFGATQLSAIARGDLQSFVDKMLAEELAASTIRNTINPLQAIFRQAVRRELTASPPGAANAPRPTRPGTLSCPEHEAAATGPRPQSKRPA